jgi:1,4-alpha-glucan branching enzyme
MNTVVKQSAKRDSAESTVKPTRFCYPRPGAKAVHLMGDFNDWNRESLPMLPRDGWWSIQVPLTQGHHHYLFLVDGKPMVDPRSPGTVQVDHNVRVSMLAVN